MKRKITSAYILVLLLGTLFLPVCKAPVEYKVGLSDRQPIVNDGIFFDKFIEFLMRLSHKPSLSVCVIMDENIIWSKGYGFYNIGKNKSACLNTIYLSASISKTVTATALMQLIENESYSIDLDEDVNNYLPFSLRNPNHPNVPITFRMLLSHRSSLTGDNMFWTCLSYIPGDPDIPDYPYPWLKNYLTPNGSAYTPVIWSDNLPGENFAYSNIGYSIVGYLVEVISGEKFDQYCKNHIFEPLNMFNTSFRLRDVNISNLAVPYQFKKGTYFPHPHYNMLVTYPAGSLRTSVDDLSHFLIAHMNNGMWNKIRILKNSTVELMHKDHYATNNDERYGLGWIIRKDKFGKKVISHTGSIVGVQTLMKYIPDERIGIIVFTNSMSPTLDLTTIEKFAFSLMSKLFLLKANMIK